MGLTGIPPALARAFGAAVRAFEDARVGFEGQWNPTLTFEDWSHINQTIGQIAAMASDYDDALHTNVYALLIYLAPPGREDFPQTFAAAGRLLKDMYDDHIKSLPSKGVKI